MTTITIDLADSHVAALQAKAAAQGVSLAGYARHVLEQQALASSAEQPAKPKKSALGLLAKYGPGPTEEEIDANRREMFQGFGEDAP